MTRDNTATVTAAIHEALADGLEEVTEDLLGEAQQVVPIEEATLSRSGFAQVDRGNLKSQVAFDTEYAIVQHEDPTLRHDAGRTHHYLEDPYEQNRARYVKHMQAALGKAVQ